ncbi:MAG: cysteine desulfurase family protein, partial [Myxococcota bacterium]
MSVMYFDHHSTTPCAEPVLQAMWPYFSEHFGNAGSRTHRIGLHARDAVEHARAQVSGLIGASPKEIVWTSGATEANNLAVLGVAMAAGSGHIIVSAIEHKAVLDPATHLQGFGFDVTVVPVGSDGVIDPSDVRAAMRPDTRLVSIMLANNEVGTIQPIAEVGAITRERGIPFHVDAVQGAGNVPIDVVAMNVDLMSITAHKMYGPKGIGCLFVRRGRPKIKLEPL